MKETLNKLMSDTVQRWTSRITLSILAFLSVWLFTTVMTMNTKLILLEQKFDDDKSQWTLIQQIYDQQVSHEVRLRFHQMIIEDLRSNPDKKLSEDTVKLLEKLDDTKKDRTVDDFRDYHMEQQQIPRGNK